MPGRPPKEFHEYLSTPTQAQVGHDNYVASPASAFLKYAVEAKSAIDLCIRQFPKRQNGDYTKDALDSLQHLVSAMLPSVMGHFETFQRYLFAGMFDRSVYIKDFDVEKFYKKLSKHGEVSFDPIRLAAHRQLGASSIGILLADSLVGWHIPDKVNSLFDAFDCVFRAKVATDSTAKLPLSPRQSCH